MTSRAVSSGQHRTGARARDRSELVNFVVGSR